MKQPIEWSFYLLLIMSLIGFSSTDTTDEFIETNGLEILRTVLRSVEQFVPFLGVALTIWDGYDALNAAINPSKSNTDAEMSYQINDLIEKINNISQDIKHYHNDIDNKLDKLEMETKLDHKMATFIDLHVRKIEGDFENLISATTSQAGDLEDAINRILHNNKIAMHLIATVDSLTEYRDIHYNVLQLLLHPTLKENLVCRHKSSIQQRMYNIFKIAHETQIKGLTMLVFAYQMNGSRTQLEKEQAIRVSLAAYFNHTKELVDLFQNYMVNAPRDMWMCDPKQPSEGLTYERFGRAFQRYLFHMRNAEPPGVLDEETNCAASCKDVPKPLYYVAAEQKTWLSFHWNYGTKKKLTLDESYIDKDNYDGFNPYPAAISTITGKWRLKAEYSTDVEKGARYMHKDVDSNRCYNGILRNCETIEERKLKVCNAVEGEVERYTYIKYGDDDNKAYGRSDCGSTDNITTPGGCTYCMCTCDYGNKKTTNWKEMQKSDTDRYIDLSEVIADDGFVVTGVRLTKNKDTHTFYIQIKQAKLLSNGRVSGANWKNIPTYYPRELNAESKPMYKENVVYHKVSFNKTVIYLDDVQPTRDDQLVTGLRFIVHKIDGNGKVHLGINVKFTGFDLETGKPFEDDNEWLPDSLTSIEARTAINVDDCDVPTQFQQQNREITDKDSYVKLVNSRLKYDVGQNVLPFIDIQDVETKPPVPLTSVGLYIRRFRGSGGYLGLNVRHIDLKRYLPDPFVLIDQRMKLNFVNMSDSSMKGKQ